MSELISELSSIVKAKLQQHLAERPLLEAASLSWVQELALEAMRATSRAVFAAWNTWLLAMVQPLGLLTCPRCDGWRSHWSSGRWPGPKRSDG